VVGGAETLPAVIPISCDSRDGVEITLFVACYNEAPRIAATMATIRDALARLNIGYEVIVVDDGSTDDSAGAVRRFVEENPRMPILLHHNERNRGLARSFVDAAFLGRGRYYRLVCGDNVEDLDTMVRIISARGEADIILPYFPHLPGKSRFRKAVSWAYTMLVDWIGGYRLRYYNGCALYYRFHVMRWSPYDYGFGFQANLITTLLEEGATYKEISVQGRHVDKPGSSSPLTLRNLLSVSKTLSEIAIRRLRRKIYG
jgi:glycosyltransferase involved in cell wall biosynthesis